LKIENGFVAVENDAGKCLETFCFQLSLALIFL